MELNFHLKGIFNASGNAEKAIDDIARFIEDANQGLLVRGAPEDRGAKVVDWHVSNDDISLEIRSDRYVRAHDAFIRLYNPLREILGKNYHIGLRGMQAKDYEIEVDLEGADLKKIKDLLSDVPEVKKIEIGEGLKIIFNELSEGDLRSHSVDKIIKLIQGEGKEELVYVVSKVKPGTVLYECKSRKNLSLDQDATELAEELGWVKRFPGKGQWTYLPPYAKLFRTIADVAVEEIPERLGFSEVLFPKLIPLEVMKKMRYLEGLPEGMYYVSPPSEIQRYLSGSRGNLQ
jgi:Seryl-tRNA synthetase